MIDRNTEVFDTKEYKKEDLLAKENVVGVGVGKKISKGSETDVLSVVVMVEKKVSTNTLSREDTIPITLRVPNSPWTVPTDVIEVGKIEALNEPFSPVERTDKWRPAPGGVSIGHSAITAGTLGVVAIDNVTRKRVILSNNHVLADSNEAMIGDAILQQGYHDGGRLGTHIIGHLLRYKEIDFGEEPSDCPIAEGVAKVLNRGAKVIGSKHKLNTIKANAQAVNYIDAAIADPVFDDEVLDEILDIGVINGTIEAYLGMAIRKSGRTTGYTHGTILLVSATVNVSYGPNKLARFENQTVAGDMSAGGDSGSLGVAEYSNEAFGLLYAGSSQSTIFNPIQEVLNILMISL